jgi:Putative Flp pilus-assembly TadE/G-like
MRRCTAFVGMYRHCDAAGQVALVAPALLLVLLGGFAALSVDMGSYVRIRQQVENAVDAAALAGAQGLPDNSTTAIDLARQYASRNGHNPDDASLPLDKRPGLSISFRCIVGDRNRDSSPDAGTYPPSAPRLTRACSGVKTVSASAPVISAW